MAQYARPDADDTVGSWTPSGGSDLYAMLDETVPDDLKTYITETFSPDTADTFIVGLSNVTDPKSSSDHVVRFRGRIPSAFGSNQGSWTITLRQSTTQIAQDSLVQSDDNTWETKEITLSSGEADSITDYTDLNVSVAFTADASNDSNVVPQATWIEFEVPDAPTGNVYVYDGLAWQEATAVYVYTGTEWKEADSTHVFDGLEWKSDS